MSDQASIAPKLYESATPEVPAATHHYMRLALKDVTDAIVRWRVWFLLANQDIRLRYRRSVLGPFWLTLSMAITIFSMGFVYSYLFRVELQRYLPYVASGMLAWTLISGSIVDLIDTFKASEGLLRQIKLPYTLYVHRIAWRNFVMYFHNAVVLIPVILIFHEYAHINLNTLLLIPGLFLVYVNAVIYGTILAMIGARYTDLSQIIKSLVQVLFFITPIMWDPAILPEKYQFIAYLNPFYAYILLIRAPMIGQPVIFYAYEVVFGMTILGALMAFWMLRKYRHRIIYWL